MTKDTGSTSGDDALEALSQLQRLGQALFEREAGRLARKHGVEDPRVQRMIRTAGGAQAMFTALENARDAVPQQTSADQGEIVVYGRVTYNNLRGASNIDVQIEDINGRVMRAAGSARTDARGHYTLRIPAAVAEKLAGKEYILTASNTKGELLQRAPGTVRLDTQQAIQVDIDLGERLPIRRSIDRLRSDPSKQRDEAAPLADTPRKRTPRPTEAVVYSVNGRVIRAEGKPAPGVLVRIYDKDRQYDDLLGAALTNRKGEFSVRYRFQDFSENEEAADLFFVVVDADEKELLSTENRVMFNAERNATVTLTIPS